MRRGLFLDLDGTLCDSLLALRAAYFSFLEAEGAVGTHAEFETLNGARLPEIASRLSQAHALQAPLRDLEMRYAKRMDRARAASVPMDGARDLLLAAGRLGWRRALVTSGARTAALRWLEEHALAELFESIVGAEDVSASKPSPEGYALAIDQLGCSAAVSIGVEDSAAGLAALAAAGLRTFHFAPLSALPANRDAAAHRIAKLEEVLPYLERLD